MIILDNPITRWPFTGHDVTGAPSFGAPALMYGRWEDKQVMFLDKQGQQQLSQAVVYIDTDVAVNDWIGNGDFVTTPVSDPTTLTGKAYACRQFTKIPDLRNIEYERKVYM